VLINFCFRSNAITAEVKLYTALRFYATGTFQNAVGDFSGISQASASCIIKSVSEAIGMLKNDYIYMPRNQDEARKNCEQFYEVGSFPTVIGTIDCTHVKISGQGGNDGEIFRNRKQYFSINVQSVANANLSFQDIVVRYPGSTHDSHIFNQSVLKQRLERGEFGRSVILGDGGYKLYPYLMTPFRNPNSEDQVRFNRVQALVRNTVERKYGVWKRRFPCLVFGLRCKLETSLTVIVACAVLHNFCIEQNEALPPTDPETEAAVEATTVVAERKSFLIEAGTVNLNRRAVLKRESFVDQIAQSNS
jgi:nuclease HARBI1